MFNHETVSRMAFSYWGGLTGGLRALTRLCRGRAGGWYGGTLTYSVASAQSSADLPSPRGLACIGYGARNPCALEAPCGLEAPISSFLSSQQIVTGAPSVGCRSAVL